MKKILHILSKLFGFKKKKPDANFTHDGLDKIVLGQFYGFGRNATGGKGGVTYYVSNETELRNAVNQNHARIIIVTNQINLTNKLNIYYNNISLLGGSVNASIFGSSVNVFCKNFIFQNIHFAALDQDTTSNHDALGFRASADIGIVDRCVASFSVDENMDAWGSKNITFQYNIIAHALNNSIHDKGAHSMAMLIGDNAKNISVLYNIFAHNVERHIRIGEGATVECIGNIFYDFKDTCVLSKNTNSTIINNVYLKGSQTPKGNLIECTSSENVKLYAKGNINDYGAKELHNNVLGTLIDEPEIYSGAPIPSTENALINWISSVNPKQPYALNIIKDIEQKKGNVIDKPEQASDYFNI